MKKPHIAQPQTRSMRGLDAQVKFGTWQNLSCYIFYHIMFKIVDLYLLTCKDVEKTISLKLRSLLYVLMKHRRVLICETIIISVYNSIKSSNRQKLLAEKCYACKKIQKMFRNRKSYCARTYVV